MLAFATASFTMLRLISLSYLYIQEGALAGYIVAAELLLFLVALKAVGGALQTWHMLHGSALYVGPPSIRIVEWMTTSMAPNLMFRNPCSVGGALWTFWIFFSWLMSFVILVLAGTKGDIYDIYVLPSFAIANVAFFIFVAAFLVLIKRGYINTFLSRGEAPTHPFVRSERTRADIASNAVCTTPLFISLHSSQRQRRLTCTITSGWGARPR